MGARLNIKKGIVYGRLTIVNEKGVQEFPGGQTTRLFLCKCECGKELTVKLPSLRSGNTTSCGCFHKQMVSENFTTHGLSKNPIYLKWCNMLDRCSNKDNPAYCDYGGRGIKVCPEWLGDEGIKNFIEWNEGLPKEQRHQKGLEIDRKDNNKGYSPKNCRWVTRKENTNNRNTSTYIVYKGKKIAFKLFYERYTSHEISYNMALTRLKRGMDPMEAVTIPAKTKNRRN